MRKVKYLFKVYETCVICNRKGWTYEPVGNLTQGGKYKCDCKHCEGTGKTEINPKRNGFEKLYRKTLQRKIGRLALELSDVRDKESTILKELGKYCKEDDRLVNKNGR